MKKYRCNGDDVKGAISMASCEKGGEGKEPKLGKVVAEDIVRKELSWGLQVGRRLLGVWKYKNIAAEKMKHWKI